MRIKILQRYYSRLSRSNTRNDPPQLPDQHGLPLPPQLKDSASKAQPRQTQTLESQSPFRRALAANPYAHILASPVRQCSLTNVKLPSDLLLPFATVFRNNKDGKPTPHLTPLIGDSRRAVRSYLINSRPLVRRLGHKKAWQRLVGANTMKYGFKNSSEWIWSKEMDACIICQMRQVALQKLKWLFDKPNAKLVATSVTGQQPFQPACILHLHAHSPSNESKVPRFHLPTLLGEEILGQLVQGTRFVNDHAVTLASSYMTLPAYKALMKLSTFLEQPAPS